MPKRKLPKSTINQAKEVKEQRAELRKSRSRSASPASESEVMIIDQTRRSPSPSPSRAGSPPPPTGNPLTSYIRREVSPPRRHEPTQLNVGVPATDHVNPATGNPLISCIRRDPGTVRVTPILRGKTPIRWDPPNRGQDGIQGEHSKPTASVNPEPDPQATVGPCPARFKPKKNGQPEEVGVTVTAAEVLQSSDDDSGDDVATGKHFTGQGQVRVRSVSMQCQL